MKLIFEYIKKYKVTYIGVILIFVIGIILGIGITFKIPNNEKTEIKEYLQDSVELLKENNIDKQNVFKQTFINNLKFLLVVWILGSTVIAGFTIYILMIYKGFLLRLYNNNHNYDFWCKTRNKFFVSNINFTKYNFSSNNIFISY